MCQYANMPIKKSPISGFQIRILAHSHIGTFYSGCLGHRQYITHGYTQMAFVINTITASDHEDLWRFMLHPEDLSYFIGNRPVGDKVEQVEFYSLGSMLFLQALQSQSADGATCTMLKNYLGLVLRINNNLFQLLFIG